MTNDIQYDNIQSYFQFLINDYGFKINERNNYSKQSNSFNILLESRFFFLRYYSDRGFVSIEIAEGMSADKWFDLSYVMDLIYNPEAINSKEAVEDNIARVTLLNNFLKKDFEVICELFKPENYATTKEKINEGLKKQFQIRYPTSK